MESQATQSRLMKRVPIKAILYKLLKSRVKIIGTHLILLGAFLKADCGDIQW